MNWPNFSGISCHDCKNVREELSETSTCGFAWHDRLAHCFSTAETVMRQEEAPAPDEEYFVKTEKISNGPNRWESLLVSIHQSVGGAEDVRIGEYVRNYPTLYNTFVPFKKGDSWYALYSRDYTATRIMELPSCRDIGGEEPHTRGFCPVDYYVPYDHEKVIEAKHGGHFGFVAGCIWGDDSSWKIQFLDLSSAHSGVLSRRELFGYLSMPPSTKELRRCIDLSGYNPPEYPHVSLIAEVSFDITNGRRCELGDA